MVYRFGQFELKSDTEELHRSGILIHLPPQPLRVLLLLVSHAGEIVTRDEIRRAVWGETFVDFDQGMNTAIRQIRRVLHDCAHVPHMVETVPRRGYRFIAHVETSRSRRGLLFIAAYVLLRTLSPRRRRERVARSAG